MRVARIILVVVGLLSVLIAPPWVPAIIVLLLTLRWRAWEVLFIGALMDVLWLSDFFFYGLPVATLASALLLWLLEPFRKELLVDRGAL